MNSTGHLIAGGVLAALGLLGAYTLGARSGFEKGYFAGDYTNEVVSAGMLIAHDGARETGTNTLIPETVIDGALLSAWSNHETYLSPPFYAPRAAYLDLDSILARLARYRENRPSDNPDIQAREAIQQAIAEFADQ